MTGTAGTLMYDSAVHNHFNKSQHNLTQFRSCQNHSLVYSNEMKNKRNLKFEINKKKGTLYRIKHNPLELKKSSFKSISNTNISQYVGSPHTPLQSSSFVNLNRPLKKSNTCNYETSQNPKRINKKVVKYSMTALNESKEKQRTQQRKFQMRSVEIGTRSQYISSKTPEKNVKHQWPSLKFNKASQFEQIKQKQIGNKIIFLLI
jgi:hypothetical protein